MAEPLIQLQSVTTTRPGGEPAFQHLSWTLHDGETWAVVGDMGCGKTTFGELLLGRLIVRSGEANWPVLALLQRSGREAFYPNDAIRIVSFKEESRLFSYRQHYYQERFNFTDPLDDITLSEYLHRGLSVPEIDVESVAARLGIDTLMSASFLTLSNGQVRRARIARALLTHPAILILDEPFMGLDADGREEVSRFLSELPAQGTRIILLTRPEFVPAWVTHVLRLDAMTPCESERTSSWTDTNQPAPPSHAVKPRDAFVASDSDNDIDNDIDTAGAALIEMNNVSVAYGGKPALQHVSWIVRTGERWAVLGPNGCGKTTLLSLICGDHPQAYGNDVRIFGNRRGSGESIWDIKKRIGLVSPELHLYFHEPLSAVRTAATGFFDVMAYRPTTAEQDAILHGLFADFGLTPLADRPFARLSTGQQRLVLLVRALVKSPELLILDEPFQGLDHETIERAKTWLDRRLLPTQSLLFVTHHAEEIPSCVTRRLRLNAGRVVETL